VLSAFLRIVTSRAIFKTPTTLDEALLFTRVIRLKPHAVPVGAGPRHWDIFTSLCVDAAARGNLVADAYLAAVAIESGCELVSLDRDFARFPGLKWRRPQ
jgi:toxin-antitoxin system PIN domain toxin